MSRLDELLTEHCSDGVQYKPLSEVCTIERGKRVTKSMLSDEGPFPVYQNCLTPMGFYESSNCPAYTPIVIVGGAAGDVGYVDVDFWAADDCVYLIGTDVLNRYVYHVLLNNIAFIKSNVRRASIPRLPRSVIENMMIPVPPIEVQREIVRILDNFTEHTMELSAALTAELAARKKQYEYYRNKLLSFDNGVEFVKLGDLFPFIRNGFVGTITPFFTDAENGVRYLEGTNVHNGVISDNEVLYVTKEFHQQHIKNELKADDILMVQSGHIGECAVVGEKYTGANCHALIIMSNGGKCNSKYVCHYFHSQQGFKSLAPAITGGTVKHVLATKVKEIKIPVPPIHVQDKIAEVLDNFEAICNDLGISLPAEITARQKQLEYYRDLLLSFDSSQIGNVERERERVRERAGARRSDEIKLLQYVFGYAHVRLEEVSEYRNQRINAAEVDENSYIGVDNLLPNKAGRKPSEYVPTEGRPIRFEENDILIGNIRPYLKKVWLSDCFGGTNGDVLAIGIIDETIVYPRYLYYVLSSDEFFAYDNQYAKGAKMPRGNKEAVMRYVFSLPSFSVQIRIAGLLDRFDTLCNDITEGLPAEIEARKRQYEYYRDRLLAFKEITT